MNTPTTEPTPDFSRFRNVPRGRSIVVRANGLRHHALAYGPDTDRPLVLLPGITSPAITWEFVAEELSASRGVLVLDMRGRGMSEVPGGRYTMEEYAADVAGIIEALGLDHPPVLGHSMGARNVAALAVYHPDVHGPLVLVDPPLTGPGRPPYPFPKHIYVDGVLEAQGGITADDVRKVYPTWNERELDIRAEWLATCDPEAVSESYDRFHDEDFFALWAACPPPVLFVYGEESPVVDAVGRADVQSANPRAEYAGVARAGHMIPWDNLRDFLQVVTDFLQRNEC